MFSWLKKLLSLATVLVAAALILNLNVGGRPSRDRALELWRSPTVQKAYRAVYDRVMALIRKDISVEEVFKPLPQEEQGEVKSVVPAKASLEQNKIIQLEKLDESDRKALEQILKKASP